MAKYPRARFATELARDRADFADLRAWAAESYAEAQAIGYRADRPVATTPERAILPSGKYVADSIAIAESRLTLAGYRLADILRAIFASP
jgi:hypothetical protein